MAHSDSQSKAPRHETDPHAQGEHIMDTHESEEHHIVPISLYWKVIGALMVLLIFTLVVAMFDLSKISPGNPVFAALNIIIAMTVAVVKAVLIILYFMHVRFSSKLVWLFAGAAFYWVVILFVLTLTDYMSRGMTAYPGQYTF